MTKIQPEYLAPCGLYCGVCRIRQATEENDLVYLQRLVKIYGRRFPAVATAPEEELKCEGCLSTRRFVVCQACSIRDCSQGKGHQGCHECADFPCQLVEDFGMPVGLQVILRAVPYRRAHGSEAWARAEEERYRCPECGRGSFRGARQCMHCKAALDLD